MKQFPDEFFWGAATSSYQIEGAARDGGRGPSIWDAFCRRPDVVYGRHTGDTACDHYNRFRDDVKLFNEIGLQAYRFSVSWSRVMPTGTGAINQEGLDFYSRLVDELLAAGIRPLVTLFHWDLPLSLHHRGGWQNRASADWFGEYAALMAKTLGDRVHDWMTLNEPQVIAYKGYVTAEFAPGERQDRAGLVRIVHGLLLAHGRAVQALRANGSGAQRIGWAPVCITQTPARREQRDIDAARASMFTADMGSGQWKIWNNTWWMDPVFFGRYPQDGLRMLGPDAPEIKNGDMELIQQPIDFIGTNIYHAEPVRAVDGAQSKILARPPGYAQTRMDWVVAPDALYWGPKFLFERYQTPMVITENGISCHDWVSLDGAVRDPQRIDFVSRYLIELRKAVSEGVPVRGYMYWSALDNFEWERGYAQRFGLIYVDFERQTRILKDSAHWYRQVIESNGANIPQAATGCFETPA